MKALIQRVTFAKVEVAGNCVAEIEKGLLVFIGIEKQDTEGHADKLFEKILSYRVFSDKEGKMNLGLHAIDGGLLLVSQFTLAADTQKGSRPSFSSAATPDHAEVLYKYLVKQAKTKYSKTETGIFAADMKVSLTNDGPVTFLITV
jgi:D-tyrosyl-tRNA(Tyr) deacylase